MQTISLRQLRDTIQERTEPAEVVVRVGDGTMRRLGTWFPAPDKATAEANAGYVTGTSERRSRQAEKETA
jgi:hypothetical protein